VRWFGNLRELVKTGGGGGGGGGGRGGPGGNGHPFWAKDAEEKTRGEASGALQIEGTALAIAKEVKERRAHRRRIRERRTNTEEARRLLMRGAI